MPSAFELVYYYLFHFASIALPGLIAVQVVSVLGRSDNPLWYAKELLGALASALALMPFLLVLYPQESYLAPEIRGWMAYRMLYWVVAMLHLLPVLTAIGVTRWNWHGRDRLGWRRLFDRMEAAQCFQNQEYRTDVCEQCHSTALEPVGLVKGAKKLGVICEDCGEMQPKE